MGDELKESASRPAPGLSGPEAVECHSGFEYAERPTALHWEGQRLEITGILAQWRLPGGKRFRVRVSGGRTFDLFYDEAADSWRIEQV